MDTTPNKPDPPNKPGPPSVGGMSKIRHSMSNLGPGPTEPEAVPVVQATGPSAGANKIRAFEKQKRHEEVWDRTPNTTGTGAIHVKTFHAKLTDDALNYMDQTINEWLDAHPQYEVKFVTATVGLLTSKLKEPNLICQVWV